MMMYFKYPPLKLLAFYYEADKVNEKKHPDDVEKLSLDFLSPFSNERSHTACIVKAFRVFLLSSVKTYQKSSEQINCKRT